MASHATLGDEAGRSAADVRAVLRSSWVWVVLITTGAGILNFAVAATTRAAWGEGGIDRALVDELSGAWCVLPFTFAMIAVAVRFPVASRRWPCHLAIYLAASAVCAAGAIACFLAVRGRIWLAAGWGEYPLGDLRYRLAMEYLKQVVGHGITLAVVTIAGLAERARARELRAAALERELAVAKLRALQMQLEPHFLFNALNLVSSCIRVDPPRAETMLAHLSDFLRATLRTSDAQEVRLEHELAAVTAYLEIMKARFADRLRVVFDVAAESRAVLVPNLVLQPLVENAVKHGIARHDRAGTVRIAARRDGDALRLTVEDDGAGATAGGLPAGSGIGLSNTAGRLAQLYGAAGRLATGEAPRGGLEVSVWIPWHVGEAAA